MTLCALLTEPAAILLVLLAAPFLLIPALLLRFGGDEPARPSTLVAIFVAVAFFTWLIAAISGAVSYWAWGEYLWALDHPMSSGSVVLPDANDPWNRWEEVDPGTPRLVAVLMTVAFAGAFGAPFVAVWAARGGWRWIVVSAVTSAGAGLALLVTSFAAPLR